MADQTLERVVVSVGRFRSALRNPPGRVTNLAVLVALLVVFATGVGAVATGSATGRWVVIGHGIAGMAIILLIPWKSRVIRHGLRRGRHSRWASLLLAALVVTTLLAGLGQSTGLVRSVGGVLGLWLHIAIALALAPFAVWHLLARLRSPAARPRTADLSRRNLLRNGAVGVAAAGLYVASAGAVKVADLPGARRRFTGSHEVASFDPASMPNTIWLDDSTPHIDPSDWRLTVLDRHRQRELTLPDLAGYSTRMRATLDCTSGWFAHQDWTGVPVSVLLPDIRGAQSLLVHSTTGYWVRFPVRDIDGLLLATSVGGAPLSAGHGFPLRMVAPGRRGFWWVKWVDRIELQTTPWWWQPPFPVT